MIDTSKHIDLTGSFAEELARMDLAFKRRLLSLGSLLRLLLLMGLTALYLLLVRSAEGDILAIAFLSLFFLILAGLIFSRSRVGTHYRRMRALLDWLRICRADAHSASRLLGFVDKTPVASGPPRRKARSRGGKMKHYYRRRVASLRFALADGNLLAVELVGRAKTKAGKLIKEDYELRGRLRLDGRRYRLPAQEWASDGFRVRPLPHAGHADLCFWGQLPVPTRRTDPRGPEGMDLGLLKPLDRALAGIYRRVRRV